MACPTCRCRYTGGTLANIYPQSLRCAGCLHHQQHHGESSLSLASSASSRTSRTPLRTTPPTRSVRWASPIFRRAGRPELPCSYLRYDGEVRYAHPDLAGCSGTTPGNASSTQLTTPNNFALVDNLQWVKEPHTLSFGITIQWQQINNANPATSAGILLLPYTANSTAKFNGSRLDPTTSGYSYASFLLGAVGNGANPPTLGINYVSEFGGRYRLIAPYVSDTWKVNSKLTIDAGLRWDYLPPYREVKNRWSFLNPNLTNPATGTPGANQFAGNQGWRGSQLQLHHSCPDLLEELGSARRHYLRS